jgi:hypothetical protein
MQRNTEELGHIIEVYMQNNKGGIFIVTKWSYKEKKHELLSSKKWSPADELSRMWKKAVMIL